MFFLSPSIQIWLVLLLELQRFRDFFLLFGKSLIWSCRKLKEFILIWKKKWQIGLCQLLIWWIICDLFMEAKKNTVDWKLTYRVNILDLNIYKLTMIPISRENQSILKNLSPVQEKNMFSCYYYYFFWVTL